MTDKCALGQFHRVHRYCLPFVREVLVQNGERRSADRERIGVIETGRFETKQTISVGINHLERIGIRTGVAEDYGIGAHACSRIFRLYGDDGLHLFGIRGIRQDGLYRLSFLRHHFRQFVGADRQFYLVEIEIRLKALQTISVEVDHGEVGVLGLRNDEAECIGVHRLFIDRGHFEEHIVFVLINIDRLSLHFELCAHFGQGCCAGREVDGVEVITRIKDQVMVDRALVVDEGLTIDKDIRQLCIVGFILHIDLHLVFLTCDVIFRRHLKSVAVLEAVFDNQGVAHDGLEIIVREEFNIRLNRLQGDGVEVSS